MKLTILLPALNEEKTLKEMILEIKEELEKSNLIAISEIIVVDNGSEDTTAHIAKALEVRVVEEKNRGYGNAIQRGIQEAKGEFIVFGDCDRSYRFSYIHEFMKHLESGVDLIIGNRFAGHMEKGAMPFSHKYIGTPFISWLGKILYQIPISDFNCGLRGIRKESIQKLDLVCPGMEYATEMLIKAKKQGLKMEEVPIDFYKDQRDRKPHLRTIQDGIRHLKILWKELKR